MPDIQGVQFVWRPEMGDGQPSMQEAIVLQKDLNRAYAHQTGDGLTAQVPLTIWAGDHVMIVAAEMAGYEAGDIEVALEDQELSIRAGHGSRHVEQTCTLPFTPDPHTVKARYHQGILFVYVDRPLSGGLR